MKKTYMKPETLVVKIDINQHLLIGSVTDVIDNLDPGDAITPDPDPITDSWEEAMGRDLEFGDEYDDF